MYIEVILKQWCIWNNDVLFCEIWFLLLLNNVMTQVCMKNVISVLMKIHYNKWYCFLSLRIVINVKESNNNKTNWFLASYNIKII